MKKEVLLSAILSVMAIAAMADEYTDPQTNVVYTYEPGQPTASVKAGYEDYITSGSGSGLIPVVHSGSPDAAGDVVILDRFSVGTSEYVVTSIGESAFWTNKNIKSVSIPETVTDIGNAAFLSCDSLTTVHLPEGLTQIAPKVFCGCRQLVSVVIPSSVTTIGSQAFSNCISLTNLNLPANLTSVGRDAFYYTPWYNAQYDAAPDGLFYIGPLLFGYKGDKPTGELVIKEGTTCIYFGAFNGCNDLTSVTIPASLTFVDECAFTNCTGLEAVHITDLAAWCGIEFQWGVYRDSSNPLFYAHHLYLNGEEVTNLVIPEGVTSIGDYAFDYCTTLNSVTIPEGVTSIGSSAFRGCESLKNVTIPSSITTIGENAFIWCKELNAVYISDLAAWCGISFYWTANPLYYGANLYLGRKKVTDLIIPEGVTSVCEGAFRNCSQLTSVVIPDGVTSIGDHAFNGCRGITSVTIPNNVTSIGQSAFANCSSLTSVTIPEGVTSIRESTFAECSSLTSVTIPANVSSIGHSAFYNCWALSSVISWIEEPFALDYVFNLFNSTTYESSFTNATLYVPMGCKARYEATEGWKDFKKIVEMTPQVAYRPFVEKGKVWKVGNGNTGNPVQIVDYYYFDGDTIIGGKTCKQMMCQRYVSPDYSNEYWKPKTSLSKVGAWYEEDQKVYVCREGTQGMQMLYDFSLEANDTLILNDYQPDYIVGPKQTGGLNGFKGVYRDIMLCGGDNYITTWLEGVGGIDGPLRNVYPETESDPQFLMSCTVGDEVIYLNDEYEDGATPEVLNARKQQIDFTHTIKTRPKAPKRDVVGHAIPADAPTRSLSQRDNNEPGEERLYGEYNALQLDINLTPLDDAYLVRITDESDKAVYEKSVNAGNIVGLNIDISTYAEGRYTVTLENSEESFTGIFEAQTTGISDAARINDKGEMINDKLIYNLQGQRLSSLQKGLNIVNKQKVYVK